MAVMAVCAVLVAGAVGRSPAALLRYAGVALAAGLAAEVLAAGAGGRLIMRLLAATSPGAVGAASRRRTSRSARSPPRAP